MSGFNGRLLWLLGAAGAAAATAAETTTYLRSDAKNSQALVIQSGSGADAKTYVREDSRGVTIERRSNGNHVIIRQE